MTTRCLFNGELVDRLPVQNRASQYGDGVFRTMLVWQGVVWQEQAQWQKLQEDARSIGLLEIPQHELLACLREEAKRAGQGVIKLSLIAADSPRGYARTAGPCHWLLQHAPLPPYEARWASDGIALCAVDWVLSRQPALAGVKHLNRLDQVMARRLLSDEYQEGLVQDSNGAWLSGIMSNLFWYQDGCWHTPSLTQSGVSGVIRNLILRQLELQACPVSLHTSCSTERLHQAELIFVCNSLIGLWPVHTWRDLQGHTSHWSSAAIQSFSPFRELQQELKHPLIHV